jgi:hypothetical protein
MGLPALEKSDIPSVGAEKILYKLLCYVIMQMLLHRNASEV